MSHGLRERRLECGLTQGELAARAGVSRQLIAAVESGRNTPAVDAGLRIAVALGSSVEELFGDPVAPVALALDDRMRAGAPVRLGWVGERMVATRLADHGVAGAGWAKPDGVWEGDRVQLLPGASPAGLVVAGCEPAFGIAEQMLAGLGTRSLLAVPASTGSALRALRRERVHAAVVHAPERRLPTPPGSVRRVHVGRWEVGLAVPGKVRGDLESILSAKRPVVQRERDASAQRAFERVRKRLGLAAPVCGPLTDGHLESARLAATLRCPGVTTDAAARAFELRFLPFEEHSVELWIADRWLDHPGADALTDLLGSAAFTQRVAQFGGYDLADCGAIVGR